MCFAFFLKGSSTHELMNGHFSAPISGPYEFRRSVLELKTGPFYAYVEACWHELIKGHFSALKRRSLLHTAQNWSWKRAVLSSMSTRPKGAKYIEWSFNPPAELVVRLVLPVRNFNSVKYAREFYMLKNSRVTSLINANCFRIQIQRTKRTDHQSKPLNSWPNLSQT